MQNSDAQIEIVLYFQDLKFLQLALSGYVSETFSAELLNCFASYGVFLGSTSATLLLTPMFFYLVSLTLSSMNLQENFR